MNILYKSSVYVHVYLCLFLLDKYLEVVLLGHRGKYMFMRNCRLIPKKIILFYALTSSVWVPVPPNPCPQLALPVFLILS